MRCFMLTAKKVVWAGQAIYCTNDDDDLLHMNISTPTLGLVTFTPPQTAGFL